MPARGGTPRVQIDIYVRAEKKWLIKLIVLVEFLMKQAKGKAVKMGERYRVCYITFGLGRGSCGHQHRTIYDAYHCLRHDFRAAEESGSYSDRHVCAIENGIMRELNELEINLLDHLRGLMLKERSR
jgi:hypothetical protein